MWPRTVEVMLALWLAVSPFVFRHPAGERGLWASDLVCAVVVATLALASYRQKWRRVHLFELGVAGWLVLFGYLGGGEGRPPGFQNALVVGLTLALFNILPSEANEPPRLWRAFYEERARTHV